MDVLPFNAERSVYLPAIDAEHIQIYCTLEAVRAAVTAGSGRDEAGRLLQRLAAEVCEHFSHEERLMRVSGYPEYAWHKRQHATAKANVKELLEGFATMDLEALPAQLDAVHGWLSYHVSVADTMASSHIRNYQRIHSLPGKGSTARKVKRVQ